MSPAPVFVRIPGSHHLGTRLRLIPGFRDPGSVLILGQVTQYGNPYLICITHWGRDYMVPISQMTFSNAFSWMKMYDFCLRFVSGVRINNIPGLVQIMAWCWPGDKPLYEPMMDSLLIHICTNLPQWVKKLLQGLLLLIWNNFNPGMDK